MNTSLSLCLTNSENYRPCDAVHQFIVFNLFGEPNGEPNIKLHFSHAFMLHQYYTPENIQLVIGLNVTDSEAL